MRSFIIKLQKRHGAMAEECKHIPHEVEMCETHKEALLKSPMLNSHFGSWKKQGEF